MLYIRGVGQFSPKKNEDKIMKSIKNLNFGLLSNEGFIGFFNNVINTVSTLEHENVQGKLEPLKQSVVKLSEYTTSISENVVRHDLSLLNVKRLKILRNFRNTVICYKSSDDENVSRFGSELWHYVKNCGEKTDQKKLTGTIENVILNVRELVNDEKFKTVFVGTELERCFNSLLKVQEDYFEMSLQRVEERRLREERNTKQLRDVCVEDFKNLINVLQYNCLMNQSEECSLVIDKLNVFVSESVRLYKMQKKIREKKQTETMNKENENVA